jgi:hypothetical protein
VQLWASTLMCSADGVTCIEPVELTAVILTLLKQHGLLAEG